MRNTSLAILGIVAFGYSGLCEAATAPAPAKEETFYTRPSLYSTRPSSQSILPQTVSRFGPVGIGIELHQPAFVMKVKNVEEGSPAAATEKLKAGQIIESINGEKLKDIDPRIQLGNIITKAEAKDGKVVLEVKDDEEAPLQKVTVSIPILGAYSETWPLNCKKSDKIVRGLADYAAKKGKFASQEMLFLLSTGEEQDLEVVKGWVTNAMVNFKPHPISRGIYQWHVGWADSSVAEYYLLTGDKSVFPYLEDHAAAVRRTMWHDGWGGRGVPGHHMGIAGTSTLRFLLLAKQCGVEMDEGMLQTALAHYSRHSGKGVNPYFDSHPEVTFTDNGKNGKLAFAMMAASALLPEKKNDWYEKASDIAAMHSFYSTSYMLHGHTGGGIGEVWRCAAMGLMIDKKPEQYRDFMNERTWFFDMSRRYDGSFGIIGGSANAGKGYDSEKWGITMGLSYTAPRKKLCMYGAPRSKYAKYHKIPERPWGSEGDDDFLDIEAVADKNGKVKNMDHERVATDTGLPFHRKMGAEDISDEVIIEYAHHPQHMFRATASGKIYSGKRYHLIPQLLKSEDARVRYVGVKAMPMPRVSSRPERCDPGFPMEEMTEEVADLLYAMLENPKESWFVADYILTLMSQRDAEELAPHADRIIHFLGHEEPWMRHAALKAIVPLALDKRYNKKALAAIEKHVPEFLRSPGALKTLAAKLNDAEPEVQKAALASLGRVYLTYPGKNTDPPGGRHPSSNARYLDSVASSISAVPGGLEQLYMVSQKRYPEAALSHRGNFLNSAQLDEASEDLQKAINKTILGELVPEHVGKNYPNLLKLAASTPGSCRGVPGGGHDQMQQLADLYTRAGQDEYAWKPYGPDRHNNEWEYFTFDPPEKGPKWADMRKNRYRKVTYPAGMENWFEKDFDAKKAGWKKGLAPIAQYDGKLPNPAEGAKSSNCNYPVCGCGDESKSLWEKEVILARRVFNLEPPKDGYRYRMIVGGAAHVGIGDGYRVYINGKQICEAKGYGGRGSGGQPDGAMISSDFFDEFKGGKVVVAATGFLRQFHRSKVVQGHMNIWFEQQKVPTFTEEHLLKSAQIIPMTCSGWQDLQNPESEIEPDEGKYRYDGKFKDNKAVQGSWQVVNQVASIGEFEPGQAPPDKFKPAIKSVAIKPDGSTDTIHRLWTGDTLLDLRRDYRGGADYQALKMTPKKIGGTEYLFVEAGGFSKRQAVGWKSPLLVMKKK